MMERIVSNIFVTGHNKHGRTGASAWGIIDNLTFSRSGNHVTSVSDSGTSPYVGDFDASAGAVTYDADGTKLRETRTVSGTATVIDWCGDIVLETDDYYPLGGPLPTGTSTALQPEKYQGKEWNFTSGFNVYDFGARLYDPSIGRWLSQDPMAEKYYPHSQYLFCAGNPMKFVDPEGKDVWEINSQGKIVNHIEDKSQDAFYLIDNNSRRIDGKEISLKYGTIKKYHTNIHFDKDNISLFVVRGDNEGKEIFEYLAKNTEVEWSRAAMGVDGSSGLNFITSSHSKNYEAGMPFLVWKQLRHGYTGRIFDHSHSNNDPSPSGMTKAHGDTNFAQYVRNNVTGYNIVFHIFTPKDSQYHEYDENSVSNEIIEAIVKGY